MDNSEQKKPLENPNELGNWMPENWLPENPEHDLSKLGGNAMGNIATTPTPDLDNNSPKAQEAEKVFDITEVTPVTTAPMQTDTENAPKLIFDPLGIAPKEKGLSPSAEAAVHNIQDLITRGDNPKDGYANYQALRKVVNGGKTQ